MKLKYTLAALVVAFGSVAQAQDGPSYEETVAFLQSKLNVSVTYRPVYDIDPKTFRLLELSRCNFSYQGVSHYNFDASELDPSRVEFQLSSVTGGGGWITSWTREGRKTVEETFNGQRTLFLPNVPMVGFILSEARDTGPRVQRALQHLIHLCGGREELF